MSDRADAHIHLFEGGYHRSFAGRPGVTLDEGELYDSLAQEHRILRALIVGFAAATWCATNNEWIASKARQYDWVRPLAYIDPSDPPSIGALEHLRNDGFVGLVSYVSADDRCEAVRRMPDDVWMWLVDHRWLFSVNSSGRFWDAWPSILERHPTLRLLVSHLGLPDKSIAAKKPELALESVLALSDYPGPRVKLSGFYALSGFEYPHRESWPLVELLVRRFGTDRLLWGSDFSPSLDSVTLPQTFGLFAHMPFINARARAAIEGENLLGLLADL